MNADDVVLTARAPHARMPGTPASPEAGLASDIPSSRGQQTPALAHADRTHADQVHSDSATGDSRHASSSHPGRGQLALGIHVLRHTGQKAQSLLSDLSARWPNLKRAARKQPLGLQAWQTAANAHHGAHPAANDPQAMFAHASARPALRPVPASHGVLRCVRWVDASGAQPSVRLRLSGRMADVCAELDRLAALES